MTRGRLIAFLLLILSAAVIVYVILNSAASRPDKAACKAAMQQQFTYGMAHPDAPAGARPAACKGVLDADLQRFADEIMNDYLTQGSP